MNMKSSPASDIKGEVLESLRRFDMNFPKKTIEEPHLLSFSFRRSQSPAGIPLLLFPGSSGTSEFFCFVGDTLRSGGLDPIFVDYPGTLNTKQLAEKALEISNYLELENPYVLGCSYSAYWLQMIPENSPFSGLILCNGFVDARELNKNPVFSHEVIELSDAEALRKEWLARAQKQSGSQLGQLLIRAMSDWLSAEDLKGRLMEVSSAQEINSSWSGKTAVIDCNDDPILDKQSRKEFYSKWPGSHYTTISGGGHYPYILRPAEFSSSVISYIIQ